MSRRLELHEILCGILGSRNVYFQPPENVKMVYPAIVYSIDSVPIKYANNSVYIARDQYMVTVIDKNPDAEVREKLLMLPHCRFNRSYVSDNLNHYQFKIIF